MTAVKTHKNKKLFQKQLEINVMLFKCNIPYFEHFAVTARIICARIVFDLFKTKTCLKDAKINKMLIKK